MNLQIYGQALPESFSACRQMAGRAWWKTEIRENNVGVFYEFMIFISFMEPNTLVWSMIVINYTR